MKALTEPPRELDAYAQTSAMLANSGKAVSVSGCVESQKWNFAFGIGACFRNKVIVTYSDARIREIYEDYRLYDKNVRCYPAKDVIFYQADVHGNKLTKDRIGCMKRLLMGLPCTLITTFGGLMNVGCDIEELRQNTICISVSDTCNEEEIIDRLVSMGYERTYQVETGGQFSVRGSIIDVFDLTEENPYRIELWGDEVSSLRSFDVESQRSIDRLESVTIYPATEVPLSRERMNEGLAEIQAEAKDIIKNFRDKVCPEEAHRLEMIVKDVTEEITEFPWTFNADSYISYFYDETFSLAEYIKDALWIIDEPGRVREHAEAVEAEFEESMKTRLEKGYILPRQTEILQSMAQVLSALKKQRVLMLSTMDTRDSLMKSDLRLMLTARNIPSYNKDFAGLVKDLLTYHKKGYRVVLLSGSHTRAKRLADDLYNNDVNAFYSENRERVLAPGEIMTMYGRVVRGFEYPDLKFVVIAESDIFGSERKNNKKPRYEGKHINDFNDLHVGDFVVHSAHGVGIYQGIEKVLVDKVVKDYMKVVYRDNGVLYVPATSLDVIMKYASADSKKPKLNKLGSTEWVKTTGKVKTAVNEIAEELVKLYAARNSKEGYCYSEDTIWQKEFEEMFPYEETDGQLEAIAATKKDMESKRIMDRLICGDVGYGKTEIAIRAAFKAVQDGKQVALLAPTTILAEQHYNTFMQRMKDFPVRIDLLSRFVAPAKQKKTINDLKSGLVDIVIGTHRILSKDITFSDLGLLIVDEEQRFGVSNKEQIKKIKDTVDVLTLTATPIPRTLHMSLIGIRDMSVLEEAPNDRLPIQTYVMEYNEEMVREAINRELSRHGQVYYVYNRVTNIADIAAGIQKLVPEANVAFAHGQMKESELERIMYDFVKGDIDVLVSTTIIETGIDIPNVNTMIIHDSDNLGLSQLYQLRGRVGRSNRTAYAFLMYKRDKMLNEVAEKRLAAIRDFTDLGSGFKVASRDLEIRGAGNILGMSQHGHMAAVGYEMYCKLLNQAVMKQKGMDEESDFTTAIDLDVDAYIPPEYILNETQKLDTYKRIAGISDENECDEMRHELNDRFGNVPGSVENLLSISKLRLMAHSLGISQIRGITGEITFTFIPDAKIQTENIGKLLDMYKGQLKLSPKAPEFKYYYRPFGEVLKDENILLDNTAEILCNMCALLRSSR